MSRSVSTVLFSGQDVTHMWVKIRWKISRLDFLKSRQHCSSLIIFQRAKLSTRNITHICWCNWRIFWKKNFAKRSSRGLVLARQFSGSPGTCNPEETGLSGLPMSWSPNLFPGSGPVGLPPVPWTAKTIERSPFFVRRGGHCCRGDLVGRTTSWIFFSSLQKLQQRAKKCIELRGEYVEWIVSLVAVASFLPGRTKNLSAPTPNCNKIGGTFGSYQGIPAAQYCCLIVWCFARPMHFTLHSCDESCRVNNTDISFVTSSRHW